jgi:hypothetical protein
MADNSPKEKLQTRNILFTWMLMALLVVGPLVFFGFSLSEVQRQHYVARTYVPVEAVIIDAHVESHHRSKGATQYVPKITYEYQVNDQPYRSSRFRAVSVWGNQDWANSVVERYPARQDCRAYYDPAKPEDSVLVRGYVFSPYLNSLMSVFIVAGGVAMALSLWFQRRRESLPAENGWFEFPPTLSDHGRLKIASLATLIWYGLGAVVVAHYLYCVPAPHLSSSVHTLMAFAALGLIPIGFAIRYFLSTRNLKEARLLLNEPFVDLGREFKFALSQQPTRALLFNTVQVNVRCVATKAKGKSRQRRILYEQQSVSLKNHSLSLHETLELSGALTIPPGQLPTGRDPSDKYTQINWEIALQCNIKGAPNYEVKFPVRCSSKEISESAGRSNDLLAGKSF